MTDDDARDNFAKLAAVLRDVDLGWVVDGVGRQVAAGRTVPKVIAVMPHEQTLNWEGLSVRRKRVSTRFLATEPYSDIEQLGLLIDAIEGVIVATAQMAATVMVSIQAMTIQFLEDGQRETANVLPEGGVQLTRASAERLTVLLDNLRQEVAGA